MACPSEVAQPGQRRSDLPRGGGIRLDKRCLRAANPCRRPTRYLHDVPMISIGQIIAAGAITAIAVAIAAAVARWRQQWVLASAAGAFLLMIGWRSLCNGLGLNGDFLPAISVGDVGCLLVGAVAPGAIAVTRVVPARLGWAPAIAGALVGFFVNVVIL